MAGNPAKKITVPGSFSKLKDLGNCPLQFNLKHVSKKIPFESSPHLERGNAVHKDLELVVLGQQKTTKHPDAKYGRGFVKRIKAWPHYDAELQISIDPFYRVVEWFDRRSWFRLKLDVVCIDGDKAWVIDWKTGKIRPDHFQLRLYAMIVMLMHPEVNEVLTTYVWLDHDESTDETYTRKDLEDIQYELEEGMGEINQRFLKKDWPARKNALCGWCPATVKMCEYAKNP